MQYAPSNEEERLLQHLNSAALSQIPDISQSRPPEMPMLPPPLPPMIPAPTVNQPVPTVSSNNSYSYIPNSPSANIEIPTDDLREISETLKSIDISIKSLCDVFVQKAKKKKKRKVQVAKKKATAVTPELQLLQETNFEELPKYVNVTEEETTQPQN
jgi:hypothetical protein